MEKLLTYHMRDPQSGAIREYQPAELRRQWEQDKKPVLTVLLGADAFRGEVPAEYAIRASEGLMHRQDTKDMHILFVKGARSYDMPEIFDYMQQFRDQEQGASPIPNERNLGRELARDLFFDMVPDLRGITGAVRTRALEDATRDLSRFNTIAHSLGTVINAQQGYGFCELCKERGLSEEESQQLCNAMAKLNVGNQYTITANNGKVPGIDYNLAQDITLLEFNNIPERDQSRVLRMGRRGNSLQYVPMIADNVLPIASLKATPEASEEERRTVTTRWTPPEPGKTRTSPWVESMTPVRDNKRHSLQVYLYGGQIQHDGNGSVRSISQAVPGVEVINGYMDAMIDSSRAALAEGRTRDIEPHVREIEKKYHTPASRAELLKDWQTKKARFDSHFGPTP